MDMTEGSVKGETEVGSRCIALMQSLPWPRRWQRLDHDGGTTVQRQWQRCELGEEKGQGESE
jgi:hypothetical protein